MRTAPGVLSLCTFGQSQPIINLLRTPGMIDQIARPLLAIRPRQQRFPVEELVRTGLRNRLLASLPEAYHALLRPTSRQLLSILGSACNRRTEG